MYQNYLLAYSPPETVTSRHDVSGVWLTRLDCVSDASDVVGLSGELGVTSDFFTLFILITSWSASTSTSPRDDSEWAELGPFDVIESCPRKDIVLPLLLPFSSPL